MHGARVRKERLRARRLPRGARVRGNPKKALKRLLALAELQSSSVGHPSSRFRCTFLHACTLSVCTVMSWSILYYRVVRKSVLI